MKGHIAALLLSLSLLGGCVTVPQGTDFSNPTSQSTPSAQSISVEPVVVSDRTFVKWNAGDTHSDGLTLSIVDYLRASHRFAAVHMPPQATAAQDHVLRFSFDKFNVHRRPYGGYFPFALITLTGYIWAGGTTHIDESSVSGQLQVHDSQGQLMHSYQTQQYGERSISLYSMSPVNGQPERQAALDDLLNQYMTDLRKQTE